jgi:hypothetical protein
MRKDNRFRFGLCSTTIAAFGLLLWPRAASADIAELPPTYSSVGVTFDGTNSNGPIYIVDGVLTNEPDFLQGPPGNYSGIYFVNLYLSYFVVNPFIGPGNWWRDTGGSIVYQSNCTVDGYSQSCQQLYFYAAALEQDNSTQLSLFFMDLGLSPDPNVVFNFSDGGIPLSSLGLDQSVGLTFTSGCITTGMSCSGTVNSAPEPSSIVPLASAGGALLFALRRKRARRA